MSWIVIGISACFIGAFSCYWLVFRYIGGFTMRGMAKSVKRLNRECIGATIAYLGESETNKFNVGQTVKKYEKIIDLIKKESLDADIAVKPTQLGYDISSFLCFRTLNRIITRADEQDVFVWIDMEDSRLVPDTVRFACSLHKRTGNVGVAFQVYLKNQDKNIKKLVSVEIPVRLCKGAYDESEDIIYRLRKEVDENFCNLLERFDDSNFLAVATHDEDLIRRVCLSFCPDEFQFLYGIRKDLQKNLVKKYDVRVYVPFGWRAIPYLIRRLKENKRNFYFVLKNFFK